MYLADVVYLAPGTTYRNIRSKPHSYGASIGIDVGDVTLADKNMPVYNVITNNEGDWYHLKKGEIVGWVLGKAGGITYLSLEALNPPTPTLTLQATHQPTNLYYWNQTNGAGYPLMKLPPVGQRCQFAEGAQLIVNPTKVNADGTVDYYQVYNAHLANPTFPVPSGYTGWFVSEEDVIEVAP